MTLTAKEMELHAMARELIGSGTLPREVKRALWAGSGSGSACALCQLPVLPEQVEYEVQDRSERSFGFHVRCHALWLLALTDCDRESCGPGRRPGDGAGR